MNLFEIPKDCAQNTRAYHFCLNNLCPRRLVAKESDTLSRPDSPADSMLSDAASEAKDESPPDRSSSDSSLLFKLKVRDGTVLAGKPILGRSSNRRKSVNPTNVVIVRANALAMFQSIENPDATGSKTLHLSLDNLSASIETEFQRAAISKVTTPMIGPTGAEFRMVNATENFGSVVSHDFSIDCEQIHSSLTPNDLSVLLEISNSIFRRLRTEETPRPAKGTAFPSFVKYKKSGSGIATSFRIEVHDFSFVVLRDSQTKHGGSRSQLVAFKLKDTKTSLGGCISALSGELNAICSVDFFNMEALDWEYAVEPFNFSVNVDQMPNELVSFAAKTDCNIAWIEDDAHNLPDS